MNRLHPPPRLSVLDGLKGIAILAVMLTHMPLAVWYQSTPDFFHRFLRVAIGGGGVGVTIFFIISGFLMGLRYPGQVSVFGFISRRYNRLFPPFLVIVLSFTLLRFSGYRYPYLPILTVFFSAFIVNRILAGIDRKRNGCHLFTKIILVLQTAAALSYVFFLTKIPSAVYYEIWPKYLQTLISFLVNATLTLPFGQYIGQLDGIYWALALEVLFYLLYPVLIIPLYPSLGKASKILKVVLLLSLFPFFIGLNLATERILGFGMLRLHLFIYFIAGFLISRNFNQIRKKTAGIRNLLINPAVFGMALILLFSPVIFQDFIPESVSVQVQTMMVIPAALVLILAIEGGNKILKAPALTFLGKYSYVLFLVHSLVIQTVLRFITPDNPVSAAKILLLSLGGSVLLAYCLHILTERRYFIGTAVSAPLTVGGKKIYSAKVTTAIFSVSVLLLLYLAFKPPVSLFTFVIRHSQQSILPATRDISVILTDRPLEMNFLSGESNMGMILTHLKNEKIPGITGGFVPFRLKMKLLNEDHQLISESIFNAYEIIDSRYHPFGFPIQFDSEGKTYAVQFQLTENSPSQRIRLISDEADLLSIYFADRKILFHYPLLLATWFMHKLREPMTNIKFWFTLIHLLPFLTVLIYRNLLSISYKSRLRGF